MAIQNADYSNINFEEMASSIGLKAKHIPMLVGVFTKESDELLLRLEKAINTKDYPAIKSAAHSMKGSAGNLKFHAVYEMAKEIEHSATDSIESFEYKSYLDAIKTSIETIPR